MGSHQYNGVELRSPVSYVLNDALNEAYAPDWGIIVCELPLSLQSYAEQPGKDPHQSRQGRIFLRRVPLMKHQIACEPSGSMNLALSLHTVLQQGPLCMAAGATGRAGP